MGRPPGPDHPRRVLAQAAGEAKAVRTPDTLRHGARPVSRDWLIDRLATLWSLFMASRSQANPESLPLWQSEHLRLLADLPHDVVAIAIDRAVHSA